MSPTGTTRTRLVRIGALVLGLVLAGTGVTAATRGGDFASRCSALPPAPPTWTPEPASGSLRVVTWNIHSGLGESMSLWRPRAVVEKNLREIASDIAASGGGQPIDVVALNEVDFRSRRSAWIDEAAFLADELRSRSGDEYAVVRGETWQRRALGREVQFGNAVLVRLPVLASGACRFADVSCDVAAAADDLPPVRMDGVRGVLAEERGVVKVRVLAGSRAVDILATHLDAFSAEAREGQAMHLLHRFVDPSRSTVLLGDLNAVPTARTGSRRFFRSERTLDILTSASLADVRERLPGALASASSAATARATYPAAARATYPAAARATYAAAAWATYPAAAPLWPLDAVLASVDLAPVEMAMIGGRASDHRGLMVRLALVDDAAELARQRERHETIRRWQAARIRDCDLATDEVRARRGWLIEKTGFVSLAASF